MKLSKRLETISQMVPTGIPCADIGADHGLLITYLVQNNFVPFGYASDNKKGPYARLKEQIKNSNLTEKIICDCCDGIEHLDSTIYKTIIITGMGGELIQSILQKKENITINAEYLVLSPQGNEYELRKYLDSIGFYPVKEEIIFEDHYYEILLYSKKKMKLDDNDFKYGYYLRRECKKEFISKYTNLIKTNESILKIDSISKEKRENLISSNKEYCDLIKTAK